jgi:hypothetical protein
MACILWAVLFVCSCGLLRVLNVALSLIFQFFDSGLNEPVMLFGKIQSTYRSVVTLVLLFRFLLFHC